MVTPPDSSMPAQMEPMPTGEPPKSKSKLWLILGVVLIILVGGAYAAYAAYYSPDRVWQRFISQKTTVNPKIVNETFNFSYTAKRIKKTKRGKLIARSAGQDHFNSREPGKVTTNKRRDLVLHKSHNKLKSLIPYK